MVALKRAIIFCLLSAFFMFGTVVQVARSGGFGGFNPPDIPDIEDIVEDITDIDYILGNLPGFGLSMDQEEPITTSFDDAVTEAAFLDGYPAAPVVEGMDFLPMCELNRDANGDLLLMPGRYEKDLETFCLHAGRHGPGHGQGYLYAPLKGPWAYIIRDLLSNSESHPEFTQSDIQYLVWAVLARTNPADMSPEMRQVARTLLTDDEFETISMGAFGIIPEGSMDQVFSYIDVPPEVERVMRSDADIRRLATEEFASYDELEAVAVLAGNPPGGPDREIPADRWSYHPDGFFIRYYPSGYSQTHIDTVLPDKFDIEYGDDGGVVSVQDEHGNRLEKDGSTLTYSGRDPMNPRSTVEESWTGFNLGRLCDSAWITGHRAEVVRLTGEGDWVDGIVEIGKFAHAVEMAVRSGQSELSGKAQDVSKEAWMYAIIAANMLKPQGTQIASCGYKDLREFNWRDRWAPYDPSDDTANPANRGCQRLGCRDPRPSQDPDWGTAEGLPEYDPGKPQASNTMQKAEKVSGVADKLSWIELGSGAILRSSGLAVPSMVFNEGLQWVVNLWEFCTGELSQDPPRFDYTEIAEPQSFQYYFLESPQDGPADMVNAQNALLTSFLDVGVLLQAALTSQERQAGAAMRGDEHWAWEQAKARVFYANRAGEAMFVAADRIDEYIALLRSQGVTDIYVTQEDFAAGQEELRSNGPSPESMQAARALGLPEQIIDAFLEREMSTDPYEGSGSVIEAAEEFASASREYGQYLMSLPAPSQGENEFTGNWLEISP